MDFDVERGVFQFLGRAEMVKSLGLAPRNESATQDYLVDFFILAGALYGNRISTTNTLSIEQLIENLNSIEAN